MATYMNLEVGAARGPNWVQNWQVDVELCLMLESCLTQGEDSEKFVFCLLFWWAHCLMNKSECW